MRPTGRIHIGNYNGVIKNWIVLQNKYECLFFIADIHALTTYSNDHEKIKENTKKIIAEWLACGIDPKKCKLFIQSKIPETFELNSILSMITPLSWLERIPTYKENLTIKTYGFLGYPVLQSADILIFNADYVPIGYDQIPHIEITREIARKFNNTFKIKNKTKNPMKEPIELINDNSKILGLDGKKMSKSNNNTILLADEPDIIKKKINSMLTDPNRIFKNIKGNPEICNVWSFHKIYSNKNTIENIKTSCETAKIGCLECKNILYKNLLVEHIPILENIKKYESNEKLIEEILNEGLNYAKRIAKKTLKLIKNHINI